MEIGNYFFSDTPAASGEMARVHADLGEYEFTGRTSETGPILSIDKKDIPPLIPAVSYKYFIVIWQNKRSIGCSGVMGYRKYGFWEEYNKALFRYATGIDIGTRNP